MEPSRIVPTAISAAHGTKIFNPVSKHTFSSSYMAHVPPLDACACQKGEQSPQQRQREVTRVFQSNGRDQANEKTGLFTSGVLRDKNKARSIKRQKQGKLTVSFSFEIKLFFFFPFGHTTQLAGS